MQTMQRAPYTRCCHVMSVAWRGVQFSKEQRTMQALLNENNSKVIMRIKLHDFAP